MIKKIKVYCIKDKDVNSVYTERKRYSIFLLWGVDTSFSNKKKAAAFQVSVNAWLNSALIELNYNYASVFFMYRTAWHWLPAEIENKCIESFNFIEHKYNRLYRYNNFHNVDGLFICLTGIEAIGKELLSVVAMVLNWRLKMKDYESARSLEIMRRQIKRLLAEIMETADPGELGKINIRKDLLR